jgi:hypothetical protein
VISQPVSTSDYHTFLVDPAGPLVPGFVLR